MTRRAALLELPIVLADDATTSLHKRLYDALRASILEGRLPANAPLPSTRDFAAQFGVARGTVVAVYEQLRGEGYLVAQTGSGTRVTESLPDRWFRTEPRPAARDVATKPLRLSRFAEALHQSPFGVCPRKNARPFRPPVLGQAALTDFIADASRRETPHLREQGRRSALLLGMERVR